MMDIVERLRLPYKLPRDQDAIDWCWLLSDRKEAADEIESLRAKLDKFRQVTNVYLTKCMEASDEWFAAFSIEASETEPRDDPRDREIARLEGLIRGLNQDLNLPQDSGL